MAQRPVKAILLLADYAVVAEGKLTVVGVGWNLTGPDPVPSAIGLVLEVPWDKTNTHHTWALVLKDSDGNEVTDPGGNAVRIDGGFEAGRPPGQPRWYAYPDGVGHQHPAPAAGPRLPLHLGADDRR